MMRNLNTNLTNKDSFLTPKTKLLKPLLFTLMVAPIYSGAANAEIFPIGNCNCVLDLIVRDATALERVDGLALDEYGNLFAALEIAGPEGGLVYIDTSSGEISKFVSGIDRADQIAFAPDGSLYLTSEVASDSTTDRLFQITLNYNDDNIPTSAIAESITTDLPFANLEGLHVLTEDSEFGERGTVIVGEDWADSLVSAVDPLSGETTLFLDGSEGLVKLEGLVVGDFGGASELAIYVAHSPGNRILKVSADGSFEVVGDPDAVGLSNPDNIEFGLDGNLYVIEDSSNPKLWRISPDGTHQLFATLDDEGGLIFDPKTGDMFVGQMSEGAVYRVRFELDFDYSELNAAYLDPVSEALNSSFLGDGNYTLRTSAFVISNLGAAEQAQVLAEIANPLLSSALDLNLWTSRIAIDAVAANIQNDNVTEINGKLGLYTNLSIDFQDMTVLQQQKIDATAYGMSAGLIYNASRNIKLGIAGNYTQATANPNTFSGRAEIKTHGATVFANIGDGSGLSFTTAFGVSWSNNDYTRTINLIDSMHSVAAEVTSFNKWGTFSAQYKIDVGQFVVEPQISYSYAKVNFDDFAETDTSDFSLLTNDAKKVSSLASLGVTISRPYKIADTDMVLQLKGETLHDLSGNTPFSQSQFSGDLGQTFILPFEAASETFGKLTLRSQINVNRNVRIDLDFDTTIGNKFYSNKGASFNIRAVF